MLRRVLPLRRLVILDSKGDDALLLPNHMLVTRLEDCEQFPNSTARVLVYRPEGAEQNRDTLDDFLQWSYDCGGFHTYVDEVTSVATAQQLGPGFLNLLTRGRSRSRNGRRIHSPLWWATQRPAGIPVACYTESQHFYVFSLTDEDDRKRVVRFTRKEFVHNPFKRYGFRYYGVIDDAVMECNPLTLRAA